MAPPPTGTSGNTALGLPWVITAVAVAFAVGTQCSGSAGFASFLNGRPSAKRDLFGAGAGAVPEKALVVRQRDSLVLDHVPSPTEANASTVCDFAVLFIQGRNWLWVSIADRREGEHQLFIPNGLDLQTMRDKPFHVYHEDFLEIIGDSPTLTLIADSGTDPLFHEAPVW